MQTLTDEVQGTARHLGWLVASGATRHSPIYGDGPCFSPNLL